MLNQSMANSILQYRERVRTTTRLRTSTLWVVVAAVVAVAYVLIWRGAPYRGTDTTDYLTAAMAIVSGIDSAQARTPGFPLFLLLVGAGRFFFLISIGLHIAAV